MKEYIAKRTLQVANHIVQTNDTIRQTAKIFSLSKSTVHNDLSKRLRFLDFELFERVKKVLQINFSEKHIRGGNVTKMRYKKNKINNKKCKK